MGKSLSALLIFIALLFMQLAEFCSGGIGKYSNVSCFESEHNALIKFKQSLIDNTARLSSWVGEDCCSWKGVGCNKTTGHVFKLDLHNPYKLDYVTNFCRNCLKGEISPSILELKHLHYLDLSMNNFTGSQIPKFLGSIKTLTYLNLSWACFEGKVPYHLGNLSSLQFLDLQVYDWARLAVDDLWWVSGLHSLKYLDLSGLDLTQTGTRWLHAINMLPSLSVLNLANCELNAIPQLPHVNFTSLTSLDLGYNYIQALPKWLFNLSSLVHLYIDGSSLPNSVLTDFFPRLTSLTILSLSGNRFNACLSSLCQLSNLVYMDLSYNGFRGVLPRCLGNLTSLTVLDLSSNRFQGSIPSEVSNLTQLQVLQLSNNKFEHEIPKWMRNFCTLRVLDLSGNSFQGPLSNLMGNSSNCFKELEFLRLYSNSILGPIPASLGGLSSLRELDLSSNQLNGSIPSRLGELSKLERLDISHNSFEGVISECHFANLKRLKFLYASTKNFIVLNVSTQWTPPFQLQEIDIGSWKVGPQFPLWLQTQKNVTSLFMSNANISDEIPYWIQMMISKMNSVDLSYNNICGKLPNFSNSDFFIIILKSNKFYGPLCFPSSFELLDFSDNLLSGHIPPMYGLSAEILILSSNNLHGEIKMICNSKSLTIIDLSNNQFSGNLPSCLGDIPFLEVLDLANNSLRGEIPGSLGSRLTLESLHLQNNNFKGNLPPSFQNLSQLITLDMAGNAFDGAIPSWIGEKLSELKILSLHSNKFNGDIPTKICNLTSLQMLNMAGNSLTGKIPSCFGNFAAMIGRHSTIEETYPYLELNGINSYEENILASINGIERRYTRTIPYLIAIDLSNNKIVGEIPRELMNLFELKVLNLSGNYLNGTIPANIGGLKQLESLDLSRNKLFGPITQSLALLDSLNHLNLSFNNFSGHIPTGNQLQTLDDPSIYIGNNYLCGAPLKPCPGEEPLYHHKKETGSDESENRDDGFYLSWFYAGMGPGFFTGFIGVCGVLHFKRSWRHAYFQLIENIYQKLYIVIAVKLNWLRRKLRQRGVIQP